MDLMGKVSSQPIYKNVRLSGWDPNSRMCNSILASGLPRLIPTGALPCNPSQAAPEHWEAFHGRLRNAAITKEKHYAFFSPCK